jgi:sugar lactone lactonase YvrE
MKLIGRVLLLALALLTAFLLISPTPMQPVAWTPPAPPSTTDGPYAVNDRLKGIERIAVGQGIGPETVIVDTSGRLYTGYGDGRVVSFAADGSDAKLIANTGGRPLALAFHPDGSLIVIDAWKGLLRIDTQGKIQTLSTSANGSPFGLGDFVVLDHDGANAYFTDATAKWHVGKDQLAIIEHGGDGRLLRYEFATGKTTTLLEGLQFANGVALAPDESYVLVNETGAYRVTRLWLKGDKAGSHDTFVDNLPCLPDNLSFNGKDRYWVACPAPRDPLLDRFADNPFVRTMMGRLVAHLRIPLPQRSMALAFDPDGKLVENLQYEGPHAYTQITHVAETDRWIYFGSLAENSIGRIARPMGN